MIYLMVLPVNFLRAGQQDDSYAVNSIFIQVLGKTGYGSVNYEKRFLPEQNVSPGIRIGLGTYNMRDYTGATNPDLIVPVSLAAFYGSPHALELSAGIIVSIDLVSTDQVREAHINGVMISVFDVSSRSANLQAVKMNVDFIQTDDPGYLINLLRGVSQNNPRL